MSDSEGRKELEGIARSIDALFSGPTDPSEAPRAEGEEANTPSRDTHAPSGEPDAPDLVPVPDSGVEPPPSPANVGGDPLTGAPVLPDLPEPSTLPELPEAPEEADSLPLPDSAGPPPLPDPEQPAQPPPLPDWPVASEPASPDIDAEPEARTLPASEDEDARDEPEPTRLDLAVDTYLDGDRSRADEIRRTADELLEARDLAAVARAVERLAIAAGEPPDESIRSVAESIATPLVLHRFARRIGAERDERRRHELYGACRTLGEPMAVAIRDDLAETTDMLSRRIYCDVLAEMGPAGRKIIEEMVLDENRFLVRNAVAILGERGGDRAVELVTTALANPDARVRREALLSLAKLGAEESGELVLGLLEDSDPDVRIAAAIAAGELHVERALRSIIKMLDQTKDPDEALPLIRALGHLGDPGAVPSIEKHATRSLLSRPRTDVRIAAYRALHQIGTPHARELFDQAVDDKEPEVQAAVREMLEMG